MIKTFHNQLDLLKSRREYSNTKKQTYSTIKKLRRRGYIFGIIITSIGILICSLTSVYTFKRIKYKEILLTKSNEYDLLKSKFQEIKTNLSNIYKVNNQISQGILGTKAGSAILIELSEIIPKTIQFKSIKTDGNIIKLDGISNQPEALKTINAFKIMMSNSYLINKESVFLTRAWETNIKNNKSLNFKFTGNFSEPSSELLITKYNKIGSVGLLNRVKLLKKEGLIK